MTRILKTLSECPPSILIAEHLLTPAIWYLFGFSSFLTANVIFGLHYILVMDRLRPAPEVRRPIFSDDQFRLDQFPSSYYLDQFDLAPNSIRTRIDSTAYCTIGGTVRSQSPECLWHECNSSQSAAYAWYNLKGPETFSVYLPLTDGDLSCEAISLARLALQSITKMDAAARQYVLEFAGDKESHAASLAYIDIRGVGARIIFRYFAVNCNADWEETFEIMIDGRWEHIHTRT